MSKNKKQLQNIFQQEEETGKKANRVIVEEEQELVTDMLRELVRLLHKTQQEGQYNSTLAERVIMLYLKHDNKHQITFDIYEDVGTLVDFLIQTEQLEDIQRALDLLNLHEIQQLDYKIVKMWRVKVLVALREHYTRQRSPKEARSVNQVVIAQLTGLLHRQDVIVVNHIYSFCINQLVEAHRLVFQRASIKKKHLEASQQLMKIVSLIEEASEDMRAKMQHELMVCYFRLGLENRCLHYESYANKYLENAYSIATRLKDPMSKQIKQQMQK